MSFLPFDLDDADFAATVDTDATGTLDERAAAYHKANPHVWNLIVKIALGVKARGKKHYGMQACFEAVRFLAAIHTTSFDSFKINNDFAAWYSRQIMAAVPELAGFFEIRRLRGNWSESMEPATKRFVRQTADGTEEADDPAGPWTRVATPGGDQ